MYWSDATYSGDPVKRAALLRIRESDPQALLRARFSEVDEQVTRCKKAYDRAYEAAMEPSPQAGPASFWEAEQARRQAQARAEELAMAAALEVAAQVRLTSELSGVL